MSHRRKPVQARSRATVARLLEAAERIVAEQGADELTTTEVARKAGVSPASLYRFFADRDDLIDGLLIKLLGDLDRHTEELERTWETSSPCDFVSRELELHVEFYERHPSLGRLWFGGRVSPAVRAAVHQRNQALAARGRRVLETAGLLPQGLPDRAFVLLTELGDRVLELAFRGGTEADRELVELGRTALCAYLDQLVESVTRPADSRTR